MQLPEVATWRPAALVIATAALIMIFRLRWSVLRTLGASAALGLITTLLH